MNVMVVPARGGIGRALETQANTVAAEIAGRLGGHHRLMHLPDDIDEAAMAELRKLYGRHGNAGAFTAGGRRALRHRPGGRHGP